MSNRTTWVIFPLLSYVMNCRYLGASYHLLMIETSLQGLVVSGPGVGVIRLAVRAAGAGREKVWLAAAGAAFPVSEN